MNHSWTIFKRELNNYFVTPIAYVFIVIFLMVSVSLTFYAGNFFERNQADLQAFFVFHPWLYLFLVPAVAMRLWSEERKSGSIELLLTFPLNLWQAVWGKFLAAWCFIGIALLLTFPLWLTVNFLGTPDNGVILASYIGSWLMAGSYLAIGSCVSALTRNQVIAFVIGVLGCFIFMLSGFPVILNFFQGWLPQFFVDTIRSFSFLNHFDAMSKGVIDLRDVIYFVGFMGIWLIGNTIVIELRKAD